MKYPFNFNDGKYQYQFRFYSRTDGLCIDLARKDLTGTKLWDTIFTLYATLDMDVYFATPEARKYVEKIVKLKAFW